jgi:hypothetical protein
MDGAEVGRQVETLKGIQLRFEMVGEIDSRHKKGTEERR